MTFLRNLGSDLVEKKLWPVALVLVLAVIAVPFLLGGGDDAPVSTSSVAPTGATGAVAAVAPPASSEVAVALEEPALRRRDGKTRDPFKQQYVAKSKETATAAVTGAGGSVGDVKSVTGAAGPTTGTGTTGTGTTGDTTTKDPIPELDPLDVYRVALRFGEPGGQKTIRDIARLSPLPNSEQPFFIFLGVLAGGKKAVFLVSSDAQVTGDGTCRPSKTNCETVEMAKGDTVFLDRETDEGTVQYELDLVSVKRRTSAQAVAARKAQASQTANQKKSAAAKDDAAGELTDQYRWDADRGVLVRRKLARSTRSAAAEPAPVVAGAAQHTAAEYRAWYIAVYLEYLRQLAAGSKAAEATQATLAVAPTP